jgi:hypothetical protein
MTPYRHSVDDVLAAFETDAHAGLSQAEAQARLERYVLLHVAVIYLPFMQAAFSTVSLSAGDWLRCALVASSVLWLRELSKFVIRATSRTAHGEASAA